MMIEERTLAQDKTAGETLAPELGWVLERVRLRASRRLAWLRYLWHGNGDESGVGSDLDQILHDNDAPSVEETWLAARPEMIELGRMLEQVEGKLEQDDLSRLSLLSQIFGLNKADVDLLHTCLALAIDPSLGRLYGYLQDSVGRSYASEELASRLFGHGRFLIWSAESPLRRWQIIHEQEVAPGEPPLLACDRQVRDWLLGENDLDASLVGVAQLCSPLPPLEGWPVDHTSTLLRQVVNDEIERARVAVIGLPGSGRRTFAANVASELGLPLLMIDADQIVDTNWPDLFVRAQRQAYLDRCALAWHGEAIHINNWPPAVPHFPLQFAILEPGQELRPLPDSVEHAVLLPQPSVPQREALWRSYIPVVTDWSPGQLDTLASRYRVHVGDISAVARTGANNPEQIGRLIRARQRDRFGRLAQRIECPFTWEDLVVDKRLGESLADLVFEARTRTSFWEQPTARRLFPRGRGLVGLFTGVPGTGKTMAAQVIANDLGLDLFRVDLAAVVSKYVGETSQNLEQILSRAEQMDIVLLFDEADALFTKRTDVKDAHDRFANTDTNYLLQAIENYGGIALLATNKKTNLDQAFIRRIRYVLDFPKPNPAQRLRIWRQILGEMVGADTVALLQESLNALAQQVEVTGAQIKFSILAALFTARRAEEPLDLVHLLRGLDRELMKEGRALSDREREVLLRHEL